MKGETTLQIEFFIDFENTQGEQSDSWNLSDPIEK